jgi:starch phosphorylase
MMDNKNDYCSKNIAYFSMEFAVDQALKIYSGGLGYLAGSYMKSAYDKECKMTGIGILWSEGYYDQERDYEDYMKVEFRKKRYYFLKELTTVDVNIHNEKVLVKAFYLFPSLFKTAPILLLSTDFEENNFLARAITKKLYDNDEDTRIKQEIVLGIGGAKVLDALDKNIDIYHINEGHALPLAFYLYSKYGSVEEVKKRFVFTTHTPIKAGNESHHIVKLEHLGFFNGVSIDEAKKITDIYEDDFNLTLAALKLSSKANAVSKIHEKVTKEMWKDYVDTSNIVSITNAQSRRVWASREMYDALENEEDYQLEAIKKRYKKELFEIVADQTGKIFDEDILTVVWARRIVEYKRPGLLKMKIERFKHLVERGQQPIQVIWAGKPYPFDQFGVNLFNELINVCSGLKKAAVLTGYELRLSRLLKRGADIWLNTPRITREASGTSGMSAAMNGAINLSTIDGWFAEFYKDKINSFAIPAVDASLDYEIQDDLDSRSLMDILEDVVVPMYYEDKTGWMNIVKHSMSDVVPYFDSDRMLNEYYEKLYRVE